MSYKTAPPKGVPTIIVAATDSKTQIKADYNCDGTDDEVEINAAIDALPSTGGMVFLMEGTYNINASITIDVDNTSLIGTGKSTIIATSSDITMISAASLSGILIKNLYIRGAGFGEPRGEYTATYKYNYGIHFTTVTDSRIEGCWIEYCNRDAINLITNSNNNIIIGNHINSNNYYGITIRDSFNVVVIGNQVNSNTGSGIGISPPLGKYSNNNIVIGNEVKDNDYINQATYSGIEIDVRSNNNIIANNRCQDNDLYEIVVYDSSDNDNIITGNICIGTDHEDTIVDYGTNTQIFNNIEV